MGGGNKSTARSGSTGIVLVTGSSDLTHYKCGFRGPGLGELGSRFRVWGFRYTYLRL